MTNFKYQSARILVCASVLVTMLAATTVNAGFFCCGSKDDVLEDSRPLTQVVSSQEKGFGELTRELREEIEQQNAQLHQDVQRGKEIMNQVANIDSLPQPVKSGASFVSSILSLFTGSNS